MSSGVLRCWRLLWAEQRRPFHWPHWAHAEQWNVSESSFLPIMHLCWLPILMYAKHASNLQQQKCVTGVRACVCVCAMIVLPRSSRNHLNKRTPPASYRFIVAHVRLGLCLHIAKTHAMRHVSYKYFRKVQQSPFLQMKERRTRRERQFMSAAQRLRAPGPSVYIQSYSVNLWTLSVSLCTVEGNWPL